MVKYLALFFRRRWWGRGAQESNDENDSDYDELHDSSFPSLNNRATKTALVCWPLRTSAQVNSRKLPGATMPSSEQHWMAILGCSRIQTENALAARYKRKQLWTHHAVQSFHFWQDIDVIVTMRLIIIVASLAFIAACAAHDRPMSPSIRPIAASQEEGGFRWVFFCLLPIYFWIKYLRIHYRRAMIKGARAKRRASPFTIDITEGKSSRGLIRGGLRGINVDNICFDVCESCEYTEGWFSSGPFECDFCEEVCLRDLCDV